MAETFDLSVVVDADVSVVELLHTHTNLSKAKIKAAMQKGAVWRKHAGKSVRVRRASATAEAGDELAIYYNPSILEAEPPMPVMLEDRQSYSLWHKPAGLMSSGSRYGDHHSIVRRVEQMVDRPTFLVHRLDRFTAGVMVLVHGKAAAQKLSTQFQSRRVEKTYQALVWGQLTDPQTIDVPIEGKAALSHVRPLRRLHEKTLVEVQIETGRKHQIRRHLAGIHHPVVGDVAYGRDATGNLQLVSVSLALDCPDTGVRVCCQLPAELNSFQLL